MITRQPKRVRVKSLLSIRRTCLHISPISILNRCNHLLNVRVSGADGSLHYKNYFFFKIYSAGEENPSLNYIKILDLDPKWRIHCLPYNKCGSKLLNGNIRNKEIFLWKCRCHKNTSGPRVSSCTRWHAQWPFLPVHVERNRMKMFWKFQGRL